MVNLLKIILEYLKSLNGYDLSMLLVLLATFDIWVATYANSKIKGLLSNSWRLIRKYIIAIIPALIWVISDNLLKYNIMSPSGFYLIFITLLLMCSWLAFSEFVSITSYLAIAEPKAFKWAQNFAIKYALPEIQKKLLKIKKEDNNE